MISTTVIDDQRLLLRCISARLNAVDDFRIAAEAASSEEAREAVRASHGIAPNQGLADTESQRETL